MRRLLICTTQKTWVRSLLSGALIFAAVGCAGEKKPIRVNLVSNAPAAGPAAAATTQPGSQNVLGDSFVVEPGKYKAFTVAVTAAMKSPLVEGHFTASGGSGFDIEVLVLEQSQYLNWQNGHKFDAAYNSGRVTAGKLQVQLPQEPGTYYVIFSNRFSYITNKAIVADVKLQYNQRG